MQPNSLLLQMILPTLEDSTSAAAGSGFGIICPPGLEMLTQFVSTADCANNSRSPPETAKPAQPEPARPKPIKVFFKSLRKFTTKESVVAALSSFGPLSYVRLPFSKSKNRNIGYGYVVYQDQAIAERVVSEVKRVEIDGKLIELTKYASASEAAGAEEADIKADTKTDPSKPVNKAAKEQPKKQPNKLPKTSKAKSTGESKSDSTDPDQDCSQDRPQTPPQKPVSTMVPTPTPVQATNLVATPNYLHAVKPTHSAFLSNRQASLLFHHPHNLTFRQPSTMTVQAARVF